jgi:hypothetical protein
MSAGIRKAAMESSQRFEPRCRLPGIRDQLGGELSRVWRLCGCEGRGWLARGV